VVVRGSIDSAVAGNFRAFLSSLLPWWFCLGLVDSLEQETRAHRSYIEKSRQTYLPIIDCDWYEPATARAGFLFYDDLVWLL
jgi:hypothetical protein